MPMLTGENANSSPKSKPISKNVLASRSASRLVETNPKRVGTTIVNAADTMLYIDFDSTVSDIDYWIAIPPQFGYEVPYATGEEIFGVWAGIPIGRALIRDFIEI